MVMQSIVLLGTATLIGYMTADYTAVQLLRVRFPDESEGDLHTRRVLTSFARRTTAKVQQRLQGNYHSTDNYASLDGGAGESIPTADYTSAELAAAISMVVAPMMLLLAFFFHNSFGWAFFAVPVALQTLVLLLGIAAIAFFGYSVWDLAQGGATAEWYPVMSLRLKMLYVVSVMALFGCGAWVVAVCFAVMAAYLTQHLMAANGQRSGQPV